MGFFDDLTKKVSSASQSAVQKGKNVVDIQKINSQINDANKTVTDIYLQLGKAYYDNNKDNASEADAALFAEITRQNALIADLENQKRVLKGIAVCPNCGAEIPNTQKFCSNCGAPIPQAEAASAQPAGKVCPTCGEPVEEGQKFCSKCGSSIEQ